MSTAKADTPAINRNFATTLLNRAAEIVDAPTQKGSEVLNAMEALDQARDEFLKRESKEQKALRRYGLPNLRKDLGNYIKACYPKYQDIEWSPVSSWSHETAPEIVAATLREAAPIIGEIVEAQTTKAGMFATMDDQEMEEYNLMQKAATFLGQEGMPVSVRWERQNPTKDPIDYWGTVDGQTWAFELTRLRSEAKGTDRKIGHPKERKSLQQQLDALAEPIPMVPNGPEVLQRQLQRAIDHGNDPAKLNALEGHKYCLVIHNQQFLFVPDWQNIQVPDLGNFDAVLIRHQESIPPSETWEVLKQSGFSRQLRSQNVDDLADIEQFKASHVKMPNPELVRSAWAHVESLGLADADIYQIASDASDG